MEYGGKHRAKQFQRIEKSRKVAGDTENVNKRLEKERYAVRENEKKNIE